MQKIQNFINRMFILCMVSMSTYADQDTISLFPLNNYDQTISSWIKPNDANYDKPKLSSDLQERHLKLFYDHYFGLFSPWNSDYVIQILRSQPPNNFKTIEQTLINEYSNENKAENEIGYGENFRPYDKAWIEAIANNINFPQFDGLAYQNYNRGISIDNLHARVLPTDDVYLYNFKLPGQGYPFDNLQMSALWAGTPVYIIGETRDHAWMLVLTPDYMAWVKSSGIAKTDEAFINVWTKAAKVKLAAITRTQTSLIDEKGKFLLLAYVGSVFPVDIDATSMLLMVPAADINGNAVIKKATVANNNAAIIPLPPTPHQFANIMSSMIGRPYGWGSMYFYNDCSAELKSLFTPFGIWLPRHSSDQVTVGRMIDMTSESPTSRLMYLMENGQSFMTIVYIGGHVLLYVGNYTNPVNGHLIAMTYQNMWGLSPNPAVRRAVIGKSLLFPLLLQYPEDQALVSLAEKKFFQASYLNQLADSNIMMRQKKIDIKSLMYPEALWNKQRE